MKPPTFAEIARAVEYEPSSADEKLWDGLWGSYRRIGTVGADPRAVAIAMIWQTWNLPKDVSILVTATEAMGAAHMELVEGLVQQGIQFDHRLARVCVGKKKEGLGLLGHPNLAVVHARPIDMTMPLPHGPTYAILVPDINSVPGCYLRDINALASDRVQVAFNVLN